MIKRIIYVAAVLGVVACGGTVNHQPTVPEVTIVEKKILVPVKCISIMPSAPILEPIPTSGITEQTVARVKREQQLIEYSNKLKIVSSPCVETPK